MKGKIATVIGASRGVGQGIAWVLAEAGATVYVIGHSIRDGPTKPYPDTIDETAEIVCLHERRPI
jgi:NAD(P)-dependent dehydrogenase (short-subunit alcohol dehydrogenase family)